MSSGGPYNLFSEMLQRLAPTTIFRLKCDVHRRLRIGKGSDPINKKCSNYAPAS